MSLMEKIIAVAGIGCPEIFQLLKINNLNVIKRIVFQDHSNLVNLNY